jgi:hypothetical protein
MMMHPDISVQKRVVFRKVNMVRMGLSTLSCTTCITCMEKPFTALKPSHLPGG